METPKTLQEAIQHFADFENCRQFMISVRWLDGIVRCPICGSEKTTYLENARVYKCYGKHPKAKFSLKVGTIFEDSPIGLEKWLPAFWLVVNCKNGVSSWELHRAIGVTQKTAWFMLHRLRLGMKSHSYSKPTKIGGDGPVEVDETFVGGNIKNMHQRPQGALPAEARRIRQGNCHGNAGARDPQGPSEGDPERETRDSSERNPERDRSQFDRLH